jgi:hypothetical protein
MLKAWVNDVNTTSLRIVTSLALAIVCVPTILGAILFLDWQPKSGQLLVLGYMAAFALTMMGFDVAQFVAKRFSDAGYASAKNPSTPSPVTVEAPSTVTVDAAPSKPTPRSKKVRR